MIRRIKSPLPGGRSAGCFGLLFTLWVLSIGVPERTCFAAAVIARCHDVEGIVWAMEADGKRRRLENESPLFLHDQVISEKDGSVILSFTDQTQLSVAGGTVVALDQYLYFDDGRRMDSSGKTLARGKMSIRLIAGIVKVLTGLIAKSSPGSVDFKSPSAVVAIRGTHFVTQIEGETVTVILLPQPEKDTAKNAILVSNAHGSVEIDRPNYGTVVPDAGSPPSKPRRMSTEKMNRVLRSIKTMQRVIIPRRPIR